MWLLFLVALFALGIWLIAAVYTGDLPSAPSPLRDLLPGIMLGRVSR